MNSLFQYCNAMVSWACDFNHRGHHHYPFWALKSNAYKEEAGQPKCNAGRNRFPMTFTTTYLKAWIALVEPQGWRRLPKLRNPFASIWRESIECCAPTVGSASSRLGSDPLLTSAQQLPSEKYCIEIWNNKGSLDTGKYTRSRKVTSSVH